eukprot:TRINITY_DN10652_c0_g1_i1.p1 TRINITY_DN10652_c0_g1~~TRINITY_DN10652_c0_g1_i1.p1  ORF type:complete len:186 (-),score=44.37 TRINITY_DN10652_c0_g1_i1:28-585(-)
MEDDQQRTTSAVALPPDYMSFHPDRYMRVNDDRYMRANDNRNDNDNNNNNNRGEQGLEEHQHSYYNIEDNQQSYSNNNNNENNYGGGSSPFPSFEQQRQAIERLSSQPEVYLKYQRAKGRKCSAGKGKEAAPPLQQSRVMIMYQGQYAKRPRYVYKSILLAKMKKIHPIHIKFDMGEDVEEREPQ